MMMVDIRWGVIRFQVFLRAIEGRRFAREIMNAAAVPAEISAHDNATMTGLSVNWEHALRKLTMVRKT